MTLPVETRPAPRKRRGFALSRWRRDESGATAVEMALISPIFFAMLFGIMQLGYRFFVSEALDTAVNTAARNIMTGQVQAQGITTAVAFKNAMLCQTSGVRVMPSFIDCSSLVIDVQPISNFSASAFTSTASDLLTGASPATFNPGAAGTIVVARVAYGLPAIAPQLTGGGAVTVGGQDVYALMATVVFRNEPF